jgi:hypothetical protein
VVVVVVVEEEAGRGNDGSSIYAPPLGTRGSVYSLLEVYIYTYIYIYNILFI